MLPGDAHGNNFGRAINQIVIGNTDTARNGDHCARAARIPCNAEPGCVVRGIVVRSRSVLGTIGAGLQTIVGGNISLFSKLCEQTRSESFDLMVEHAHGLGANGIICARYESTELMNGVTEVLAYGTAVVVERIRP